MRLSCKYDNFLASLLQVSSVAEDSLAEEKMRNIIFRLGQDGSVTLCALHRIVVLRSTLIEGSYELTLDATDALKDGYMYFQVSSKELREFLNSYKFVRKTIVEDIIFEFVTPTKLKCTVLEHLKLTDEERMMGTEEKEFTSNWVFDSLPIAPKYFNDLCLSADDAEFNTVDSTSVLFHTKSLLPLLSTGNDLISSVFFGEDNIIVVCSKFSTMMKNQLAGCPVFRDIRMVHKGFELLAKLASTNDYLQVAKMERHLVIRVDGVEAFVAYYTDAAPNRAVFENFKKDHVITLDRIYFKDILKRLSLTHDNIETFVNHESSVVKLNNTKYAQELQINYMRGMEGMPALRFKVLPDIFMKALIGDDEEIVGNSVGNAYGGDVYIYMNKEEKDHSASLLFSDSTGLWFSLARVNTF